MKLRPGLAVVHAFLGQALLDDQKYDAAADEYRAAAKMAPSQPEAHAGLGRALGLKGNIDDAIAEYRQAIALAPDRPAFHDELGVCSRKSMTCPVHKENSKQPSTSIRNSSPRTSTWA